MLIDNRTYTMSCCNYSFAWPLVVCIYQLCCLCSNYRQSTLSRCCMSTV